MLEIWATLKVYGNYVIPLGIVFIIGVIIVIDTIKWKIKINFLKKNNYERYLIGVPAMGNGAFYGWKNSQTNTSFDERDLKHMGFRELVKQVKKI